MFRFAGCLRSSAAVTPAKYELDISQLTIVLVIPKKWENNGTEKIGLVTPTPGLLDGKPLKPWINHSDHSLRVVLYIYLTMT